MSKNKCPMLNKKCIEHDCAWFIQVQGIDNNSGQEVNDFACAMAWMPVLLIENSNQQRSTGAAVESFRNEMVKSNNLSLQLLSNQIIEGDNK